ncbi:hypothetical protein [Jannaschia sp. 2305UL9-9]|uniref:hypothetical protein n=1 Tax=Jannaschia sp. 2305UL9-9 TaxID=3121638 RepID=UPI003526DB63
MTNLNAAQLVERINKVRKIKGMEPVELTGVAKAKLAETLEELRADLPDPTEADVLEALSLGKYRSAAQVADAHAAPVDAVQTILDALKKGGKIVARRSKSMQCLKYKAA